MWSWPPKLVCATDRSGGRGRSVNWFAPQTSGRTVSRSYPQHHGHGRGAQPVEFPVGESFARILTEATQSLVCVLDRDGRILLFNEACERATGFRREDLLGRDARDFVIPPEEREAFGEFLAYVWKTGTPSPQVGHWQTKDGGRRLIAWSNKPMAGAGGAPVSLITTGHRPDRSRAAARGRRARARGRPRGQARRGQPARHRAARAAARGHPRRLGGRAPSGSSRRCPRSARACCRSTPRSSCATRATGRRRSSVATTATTSTSSTSASVCRPSEHSAFARVLATGAPARIDDWGGLTGEVAEAIFRTGYRSTAAAPIVVAGTLWGAVAIASEDPLPPESEERLGAFCELASLAVASAQARADLIASRARLVKAGDEQRRRLERNLHDGAQQRFVSVVLKLRLARARLGSHPEADGATCWRTPRASSTPGCRSCARSRAGCTRRSSATRGCAARWRRSPSGSRSPVDIEVAERAAARARRGDGLLHRLRGAHQRRQARGGRPRAGLGPP